MSTGPDANTVMIQPVKNGWIVLHWPPEPEEPEENEEDSDEGPAVGYDPSASFAASQRPQPGQPQVQLIGHMHMRDEGPEAQRYVFAYSQQIEMLAFVTKLTKASIPSS